jgi:hypothetical protein
LLGLLKKELESQNASLRAVVTECPTPFGRVYPPQVYEVLSGMRCETMSRVEPDTLDTDHRPTPTPPAEAESEWPGLSPAHMEALPVQAHAHVPATTVPPPEPAPGRSLESAVAKKVSAPAATSIFDGVVF